MHDFINVNIAIQEMNRELNRKHRERFDPDGLAQYEIWDSAYSGPSLRQRVWTFLGKFRRRESSQQACERIYCVSESVPQKQ